MGPYRFVKMPHAPRYNGVLASCGWFDPGFLEYLKEEAQKESAERDFNIHDWRETDCHPSYHQQPPRRRTAEPHPWDASQHNLYCDCEEHMRRQPVLGRCAWSDPEFLEFVRSGRNRFAEGLRGVVSGFFVIVLMAICKSCPFRGFQVCQGAHKADLGFYTRSWVRCLHIRPRGECLIAIFCLRIRGQLKRQSKGYTTLDDYDAILNDDLSQFERNCEYGNTEKPRENASKPAQEPAREPQSQTEKQPTEDRNDVEKTRNDVPEPPKKRGRGRPRKYPKEEVQGSARKTGPPKKMKVCIEVIASR